MFSKRVFLGAGLLGLTLLGTLFYWSRNQPVNNNPAPLLTKKPPAQYNPVINSTDFVNEVSNKYFTPIPGTKFSYQKQTPEGIERTEVEVTYIQKPVMGIPTIVVRDRVWLNDELIEDTQDWFAQDKTGNVWYFGEAVDNYENGTLKDHHGSWEAGVDGAKPGIIMKATPTVGDSYRQEYYIGIAEDMGEVVAINKTVTVPYGTYQNCLQTRDWNRLDPSANEYKYYCPDVGYITLEEAVSGKEAKTELVTIITP